MLRIGLQRHQQSKVDNCQPEIKIIKIDSYRLICRCKEGNQDIQQYNGVGEVPSGRGVGKE